MNLLREDKLSRITEERKSTYLSINSELQLCFF